MKGVMPTIPEAGGDAERAAARLRMEVREPGGDVLRDLLLVRRSAVQECRIGGAGRTDLGLCGRGENAREYEGDGEQTQAHRSVIGKTGRIRDRRAAGEALADVDRGLAVDERLSLEQRHAVGRAERDDGVRVEAAQRGARDVAVGAADDRELARRREVEVERAERPAERRRRARQRRRARAAARRPRGARARRRPRSARAAAARTRASSFPTASGCRRGPSAARRAPRRRPA